MARRAQSVATQETDPITGQKSEGGVVPIETKEFFRASEFWVLVLSVIAIAITAAADEAFDAPGAMRWITIVVAAYILSRGIAKAGSSHLFWGREFPTRGRPDGNNDYSTLEERLNRLERTRAR